MNSAATTLRGRILAPIILALCLCGMGGVLAQTAPPLQGNNYQGAVASVDTAHNSFVITTRIDQRSVTVQTDDKTRVVKSTNIGLSGLKTGDEVVVAGQVDASSNTVTARAIMVRAATAKNGAGRQGAGRRALRGTVASTSPNLTVTGDDGKTYTVQPASDNIPVVAPAPGTFADIQVGENVTVHGKPAATDTIDAKLVEIRPAGLGRGRGRRQQAAQ